MGEKVLYRKLLVFSYLMFLLAVLAWPAVGMIESYCQRVMERERPELSAGERVDIIDRHRAAAIFLFYSPIITILAGVSGLLYRGKLIEKAAFVNACRGSRSSA